MLNVQYINKSIVSVDNPAPNVYIDYALIYENKIKIFFHISDDFNEWHKNKQVVDNLYLTIKCGDKGVFKEALKSLVSRNKIINDSLYDYCEFIIDNKNLSIKAYCENDNVIGEVTSEQILSNGQIVKNSFEQVTYEYINKYKELYLLDIERLRNIFLNPEIENLWSQSFYKPNWSKKQSAKSIDIVDPISDLFVSYNTNKNASMAFVFDMEKYLEKNSSIYSHIKKYKNYKNSVLLNSSILKETFKVYKKNITKNKEYETIEASASIVKLQDGSDNNKYIVTFSDKNTEIYTKDKFGIKIGMVINDHSETFINNEILNKLYNSKELLYKYNQIWDDISQNSLVTDSKKFVFEQVYENLLSKVVTTIEDLSTIFSFYTGVEKNSYYVLFTSILHPLTYDKLSMDMFIKSVERIQDYIENIVNDINSNGLPNTIISPASSQEIINKNKSSRNLFEHEFSNINQYGAKDSIVLDYDYDLNYGLEVISSDNFDIRSSESINGLKIISAADKQVRKVYEINKYFSTTSPVKAEELDYLSVSFIDLGDLKYSFLLNQEEYVQNYNELYCFLNQYNDHEFKYYSIESYFYQLLDEAVYVKTIGTKNNVSKNTLLKAIVFDPNLDSKQASLEFISSTGVNMLYNIVDDNKFIDLPSNIPHSLGSISLSTTSSIPLKDAVYETKNNPESKPENILTYNCIYFDKLLYGGNNYELWELQEAIVNPIFNKKLRLFNRYYIVEKVKNAPVSATPVNLNKIKNELLFDVPTAHLNRETESSELLISTNDL